MGKIPLFGRIRPEFQRLQWKDNIRIPMFVRIGPEFRCKNRVRISMFGTIR